MKKLNRNKLRFALNAADKRVRRRQRHNRATRTRRFEKDTPEFTRVYAPAKLDIYSKKNVDDFLKFLTKYRKACFFNKNVLVCFRHTNKITAAAGLLLVAETDRLVSAVEGLRIRCSLPPAQAHGDFKSREHVVESALKQIGYFDLIKQKPRQVPNYASVSFWRQLSGLTADGSLAARLFESLPATLSPRARGRLYRGAIEAISNCVDHAYPDIRKDGLNIEDKRWWMLVGIKDGTLAVIVCDLGVGIPNTLYEKNEDSLIVRITKNLGIFGNSDADLIHTSTFIKRSRTKEEHRGKGGPDFRSIIEQYPDALLSIHSNRGSYTQRGLTHQSKAHRRQKKNFIQGTQRREWKSNQSESIHGTLIEWTLSLEALLK